MERGAGKVGSRRDDIQGLRAIAVLLVVLYHAGVPWLPGGYVGVDVFFVISGFLITGGLIAELRRDNSISWLDFYARRAVRILPAACLTIVGVLLLSWLLLPKIRWESIAHDGLASLLYVQNWRLAETSTDYLTGNQAESPLQHFWSLAVEEQFYILWPILLTLVLIPAAIRRRLSLRRRRGFPPAALSERYLTVAPIVVFLLVAVPSLWWSIHLTPRDPSAYFATTTRVWELALGAGLAAIATQTARAPRLLAALLGWAGLAAVIAAGVLYTEETVFPGYHALLPTVGTALIIAAGGAGRWGPAGVLSLRPFIFVGDLSYSFYLWHWPLLVIAAVRIDNFGQQEGLIVAALSLIPAWLSTRYVEVPLLRLGKRDDVRPVATRVGLVTTAAGMVSVIALVWAVWPPTPTGQPTLAAARQQSDGPNDDAERAPLGAEVLADEPRNDPDGAAVDRVEAMLLTPEQARSSVAGCSAKVEESGVKRCGYGAVGGDLEIALVGDSHAAQWATALDLIGEENDWSITEYTRQSCPLQRGTPAFGGTRYDKCAEWARDVEETLLAERPDLVLVSSLDQGVYTSNGDLSVDAAIDGTVQTWEALQDAGLEVMVLGPTPYPEIDIPDCISANMTSLTRCAVDRDDASRGGTVLTTAAERTGVPVVELFDAICPGDVCAPVIGGIIVYADTNHVTSVYAETMAPRIENQLSRGMRGLGIRGLRSS